MTMLLAILIGVSLLFFFFHKVCSIVLQCCAEMLGGAFQESVPPLAKSWAAVQGWISREPMPPPSKTFFGCAVLAAASFLALTNFGVLQELLPNVFPFGGGGNSLALTLAISTCFVGLLSHEIECRGARVALCFLAAALIVLNSFLAYGGAVVVYNREILQSGGVPEAWPLNRDVITPTCMTLFCSTADFVAVWGGLLLAGSAIAKLLSVPFCSIYIPLFITRWFNRHQVQAKLQDLIQKLDARVSEIKLTVAQKARDLWQHYSSENRHQRKLAQLNHQEASLKPQAEYEEKQLEHRCRITEAREKADLQAKKRQLDHLHELGETVAKVKFDADLTALKQQAVCQAINQIYTALNTALAVELAQALPNKPRDEQVSELNSAQIGRTNHLPQAAKCHPVYARVNVANQNNHLPSRFKGE